MSHEKDDIPIWANDKALKGFIEENVSSNVDHDDTASKIHLFVTFVTMLYV